MLKNKGYIIKVQESKTFRGLALCLAMNIIAQLIQPSVSLALTEGPSQPEVQSFEPIGTTQMVDAFSGDFNYNIPLFNLPGPNGGYPVNLAYHAGVTMDDEASWVGLGWNLNVGALVRNMRGIPDEFLSHEDGSNSSLANGGFDYLEVKSDMKKSWTLGASIGWLNVEVFGGNLDLNVNASVYYNSYKGVGIGIGASESVGSISADQNFSAGLSLDSENGLGVNVTLSHKEKGKKSYNDHKISIDFNGDLSLNYSLSRSKIYSSEVQKLDRRTISNSYGTSFSFARNSFSPSVSSKINYYSISGQVKFGVEGPATLFSPASVGIFFNTQDYSNIDKNGRKIPVVGYDRQGDVNDDANPINIRTQDFTRQNDGMLTKGSVFLPSSFYTYDTYHSTAQGLSGYFRPQRNDIGKSFDPYVYNLSLGLSVGFDLGAGATGKVGLQVGVNFGWEVQSAWKTLNGIDDDFLNPNPKGINENLYYKSHGEPTLQLDSDFNYMGGLDLAEIKLMTKDADNLSGGKRKINSNVNFDNDGHDMSDRVVRNTLVHTLKNSEVYNLGEFDIKYFSANSSLYDAPDQNLNRTIRSDGTNDVSIDSHKAGFKVLNSEGNYYVYGLPAYNKKEVENLFTVDKPGDPNNTSEVVIPISSDEVDYKRPNSHKYINKTTKSPYAHSFLLTSVQGADYVDITNNGPSDDDLGYWVKFSYLKATDKYQWRSPYNYQTAAYSRNAAYTPKDDKASYQYGEKEIWYVAKIETKSHIAVFITETRNDNLEAVSEIDNGNSSDNDHGRRLKEIKVYEKKSFGPNAIPLQTIVLEHSYDLCANTPNSSYNSGKLTLKSLSFNSMGSTRGELNKYKFDYSGLDLLGTGNSSGINPSYTNQAYDSWGVYQPFHIDNDASDPTFNKEKDFKSHFPYVNQFNQEWHTGCNWYGAQYGVESLQTKSLTKQKQDENASAWSLNRIQLPSGGVISIKYETDDYAYVQHKTANQMFKITKLGDYTEPDEVYNNGNEDYYDTGSNNDEARRRIYFKLEKPIPIGNSATDNAHEIYDNYVEPMIVDEGGNRNLYFKTRIRLIKSPQVWDYVSGYLPLEPFRDYCYGVKTGDAGDIEDVDGESCYTHGFVTIKPTKKKADTYYNKYHPIALAAWTYLQTDAQELLNNPNSFGSEPGGAAGVLGIVADVINVVPMLMNSLGSIRPYCKSKKMAQNIDLDKSCIRLASPDKIKYGGGHRVQQISITDNWDIDTDGQENSRTYGQHYDYTIEEDGRIISSGVAQYEPQAGGDENALKYPIYSYNKASTFTRNNLFQEAPANEALFPGASVGYSKVTISSLNTYNQLKSTTPTGRTGGMTVKEFYTSKDFPTMVEYTILSEQNSTKDVFNMPIPIPFIGAIKRNYFHGTQAYKIETNDMHGKPRSIKTFELNNYSINSSPITESVYEYQMDPITYQGENVYKVNSSVDVIPNNGAHDISLIKRLLGVEVDLFTDQRESKNFSQQAGLNFNVDITFPLIPFVSAWPSFTNTKTMFRTYVTNKVVHRTGILKKTISRDLQATNESEVLAYDEKSGTPLLSKVKNEFGDEFYSYNIPAYYHYEELGHAYQNINFNFIADITLDVPNIDGDNGGNFLHFSNLDAINHLVRGDELLIVKAFENSNDNTGEELSNLSHKKGYFLGFEYDANGETVGVVHFPNDGVDLSDMPFNYSNITDAFIEMRVIRSGRRNHFDLMAANYLTKGPIIAPNVSQITNVDGNYTIQTPEINPETVLSASASLFKDNWNNNGLIGLRGREKEVILNSSLIDNPYLTGNSGIWRPYKSYSYVGARKSNSSILNNNVDLKNDGVFMESVPMFSWEIGNFEDFVANWEWVNEVTRYSDDSYETENVNRLGIYSSALYGYDNSLSIAVGGNASYFEIGAVDFETSKTIWEHGKSMIQTNMNFHNSLSSIQTLYLSDVLSIKTSFFNGSVLQIKSNTLYSDFIANAVNYDPSVTLTLNSSRTLNNEGNKNFFLNGTIDLTSVSSYVDPVDGISYAQFNVVPYIDVQPQQILPNSSYYTGKMRILVERNLEVEDANSSVSFVNSKSHTGVKSMKVSNTFNFEQPKLKLIKDKEYVLSLWVSKDDVKVASFSPENLIKIGTRTGALFTEATGGSITVNNTSIGKVIEGWQKIEIEFQANVENEILAINFIPGIDPIYIDDIRFSPKTGGITTYVYDIDNFWLIASLNVDNYATLFFYDEEGNLTLKKQETEEGIFTITESRGHVSED